MTDEDKKFEIGYVPDDPGSEEGNEMNGKGADRDLDHKKKSLEKKLHNKIKSLEKTVEKLTSEIDELKDKYLRNLAEVDNFRKRIKKEKEEHQKYALGDFLKEILVIADNMERALKVKNGGSSGSSIFEGVEMIYRQFMEILGKTGVSEIEALNRPFDPNVHQALSKDTDDSVTEPTVVEVYQKGFVYNNKLLRPSLTRVAIPPETGE